MQTPGYVAELSLMVLQVDATLKSSRIASRGKNDATFYFFPYLYFFKSCCSEI